MVEHEKEKVKKTQIELKNLLRTNTWKVVRQCIDPTRYAYILYYQATKRCFLSKSTKN